MNSLFSHADRGSIRTLRLTDAYYVDRAIYEPVFAPVNRTVLLSELQDVSVQEAAITKDLLHSLLGYEGSYVRFSDRYNRKVLHDRIHGPDFKVAKHLDVSLKTITKKILRYGKYYSGLKLFAEIYDNPQFGRVNQSLCWEIRNFLDQFEKLVLTFEGAYNYNGSFTLNRMDNDISTKCADTMVHLYEIACSVHTDTEDRNPEFRSAQSPEEVGLPDKSKVPNFNVFLKYIREDLHQTGSIELSTDTNRFEVCKGGLVLQIVARRISQYMGDAVSFRFLSQLFDSISKPYIVLLNQWLAEGEIDDPFQEFFIKKNDLPTNIFYSNIEKHWDELYVIKVDGIMEQFESKELQTQVLATGKYLNIFRQCTGISKISTLQESNLVAAEPRHIESLYSQDLSIKVKQFYDRANNLLLRLLFEGYDFHKLMSYLHQTFLLKDSSLIDSFLEKSFQDLSRNKYHASTIKPIKTYNELFLKKKVFETVDINVPNDSVKVEIHEVLQSCEKFTVDSNSFYEMAEEIINIRSFDVVDDIQNDHNASSAISRLVSKSLQRRPIDLSSSGGSRGQDPIDNYTIAGVNIDINFPFPLSLIISENFVFEYQLLFKLQMILKFASKYTEQCWKDINFSTVWKHKNFSRPIKKLILRCRVLNSRMRNMLNEIQNYLNFTIVESNFKQLDQSLTEFERTSKNVPQAAANTETTYSSQLFLRHLSKNNDIFTEKILASTNHHQNHLKTTPEDNSNELIELSNKIGTYLSNTLRDSMITSNSMLTCLRALLNGTIQYNNTVSRLKKSLISMDEELLQAFRQDFPDKFGQVEISEALVNSRIAGLSEILTGHWNLFNTNLQEFLESLRSVGAENALMNVLVEKLQVV